MLFNQTNVNNVFLYRSLSLSFHEIITDNTDIEWDYSLNMKNRPN